MVMFIAGFLAGLMFFAALVVSSLLWMAHNAIGRAQYTGVVYPMREADSDPRR